MSDGPVFHQRPPLVQAREYAGGDLKGNATPAQVAWLYEHPALWLRALSTLNGDVDTHIAKSWMDVGHLKPKQSADAVSQQVWVQVKGEIDRKNLPRLHFKRLVERRRQEVLSMFGEMNTVLTGDMLEMLTRLDQYIEDDNVEAARNTLAFWIARLSRGRGV